MYTVMVDGGFSDYKNLIDVAVKAHTMVCQKWESHCNRHNILKFNQSNVYVRDITNDESVANAIFEYQTFLVSLFGHIMTEKTRSRIKARNSIEDKISRYMKNKEKGAIPIRKCLNDIFGSRIITPENIPFDEIKKFVLDNYFDGRIKIINSSKQDYHATHLYFHYDNNSFDWEMQVWYKELAETNERSHSKYKQKYTSWEEKIEREDKS